MASINETRDLARKMGLHVPSSLSGREQMRLIATQIGIVNFTFTPKNLDELYDKLKKLKVKGKVTVKIPDIEAKVNIPASVPDDNYDKEYEVLEDIITEKERSIEKDLDEIPEEVKKDIRFISVNNYSEIFDSLFRSDK